MATYTDDVLMLTKTKYKVKRYIQWFVSVMIATFIMLGLGELLQ